MIEKRISPIAIQALKEVLCSIYWYKSDLRSFLSAAISDKSVIASVNWEQYKRQIVSDVIDRLCSDQDKYLKDLLYLCKETTSSDSFPHLEKLDGGKLKAQTAKEAVRQLREILLPSKMKQEEDLKIEERRKNAAEKLKQNLAVQSKLEELKNDFFKILSLDPQKRGFALEKLMYSLFNLFDLDPRASFKIEGEQIDGAFSFLGTDYLFEAKWKNEPCERADLDAFNSKISRKLENTLGLFLSINDFSPDAVKLYDANGAKFILMTGAELMAILEGRIDFTSLILMKKRHASQTGKILMDLAEIYK